MQPDKPKLYLADYDRMMGGRSLYYLCKEILGYNDMVPHVHGELCHFLTNPTYGRHRQATVPRSWFKTWTGTVGGAIWLTLPDEEGLYRNIFPYKGPDARILVASNISDNAEKMINKIRSEWMKNDRLKEAFSDLVPDFGNTRWSNSCAELRRKISATEGTYTSVGVGGGVISQHFDHIIEDDLVYAKKDDFSGDVLMPNQEDINKAIGWHKLSASLYVNPKESGLWNIGTRWAPHDLIDYIRTYEPKYKCFEIAVTHKLPRADGQMVAQWPVTDNSQCVWPERYDKEALEEIEQTQGFRIFETQYLNRPRASVDVTFDSAYLVRHSTLDIYPRGMQYLTIVDLAGWEDKKGRDNNVILTGAKDHRNHLWIARIDAGRFNPSEVIDRMKEHQKQFDSKVMVEEVQYQTAIRHFATLDMEKEGSFWYTIEQIPSDNRKNAKDLRIQGMEPLVRNGAIHILAGMAEFVLEMDDYPMGITKDRLDAAGWLLRLAMPSQVEQRVEQEGFYTISREKLEKECYDKSRTSGVGSFGSDLTPYPFSSQIEGNKVRFDW